MIVDRSREACLPVMGQEGRQRGNVDAGGQDGVRVAIAREPTQTGTVRTIGQLRQKVLPCGAQGGLSGLDWRMLPKAAQYGPE